jgi:phosphoribosylglycinamide formyltransferase-1
MGIGVLVSGAGSNLEAILEADLPVTAVVADRECRALELAAAAGIPSAVVLRGGDRVDFTHRIVDALDGHGVDLVAMAGFMTILEKPIFDAYPGRVINTHPSLLPSFRGAHAVADALAAGVKVTGCTIHVATPEVDNGPILAQEAVTIFEHDTADSLHERIKEVEHRIYPEVLRRPVTGNDA